MGVLFLIYAGLLALAPPPRAAVRLLASEPARIVRVRNVPFDADAADLQRTASRFGDVEDVWLASWGRAEQKRHRGFGRITFKRGDAASDAIGCGELELHGRKICIEVEEQQLSRPPQKKPPHERRRRTAWPPRQPRRNDEEPPSSRQSQVQSAHERSALLESLSASRLRDYASAKTYQRAVQTGLARIGPLVTADEYGIAMGAACRSRDPQRCLSLLRAAASTLKQQPPASSPPPPTSTTAPPAPPPPQQLSPRAYHAALSACIGPARWRSAMEVLEMMPRGMPTVNTYSLAARACAKANRLKEATSLLYSIDVSGLSEGRLMEASPSILSAYNSVLEAAARLGEWREAVKLVTRLRSQRILPSTSTYLAALKSCAAKSSTRTGGRQEDEGGVGGSMPVGSWRWGEAASHLNMSDSSERAEAAKGLITMMNADGLDPDLRCYNTALLACAQHHHDPTCGIELFNQMGGGGVAGVRLRPDLLSYSAVLSCCNRDETNGGDLAIDLLARMKREGIQPDRIVYGSVISACAVSGDWRRAVMLLGEMERKGGDLAPDVVCYSSCISAYGRGDRCDDALKLLERLVDEDDRKTPEPNTVAYNAAISACERAGRWEDALRLLEEMKGRQGCEPNTVSLNAAISACEKGGQYNEARRLREESGVRVDAATYNAAISALEKEGDWKGAYRLFEEMCEEGGELTPTMVTYNALMQALGAAGRVEEGFALLKRFEAAGYADTSKSYSLHRSLLQLCRRHGTAEQVEAVSERMERRKLTAVAPIAKAADPSHPNGRPLRYTNQNRFTASTNGTASAVGSAAREMWVKLARSRTYKPVYDALPYAFTRKARRIDMMRSLQGHAEKLCLADLLRRERDLQDRDDAAELQPLELSISFKVCADCHAFFKAASRMLPAERGIIVREPKMTHVFKGGECDCGDRWRWEARSNNSTVIA